MSTTIEKDPIVQITAHAIILYPDNKGYATKHTYCANMDGEIGLIKPTLTNILEQRFPYALKICFVTPEVYEKAVSDGKYDTFSITESGDVNLPSTILFKTE